MQNRHLNKRYNRIRFGMLEEHVYLAKLSLLPVEVIR